MGSNPTKGARWKPEWDYLRIRQWRSYAGNAWNWNSTNWNNNNKTNTFYGVAVCELREMQDERLITIEELYEAYFDCRKNKRKSWNALAFELDYETNLRTLLEEINDGTYTIGRSLAFVVTRPKLREVFAADFRDRIVHHLVIRKIEPLMESVFIEDSYNCRKGKGTLHGVKCLAVKMRKITDGYTRDAYVAKFDCAGFFMSIHKPTLCNMVTAFLEENYRATDKEIIIRLARQIILHNPQDNCHKRSSERLWDALPKNKSLFTVGKDYGLPIGNLSSQIFANFYLLSFDRMMSERFMGMYGRYVDDFYVLAHDKKIILDAIPDMKVALSKLHVTLHPDKFYIQHYSKGVSFTGGVVKPGRKYVGNRTVYNFRECIRRANRANDKEGCAGRFSMQLNSYLGFCVHYASYGKRIEILKTIDRSWRRYFYISGPAKKVLLRKRYDKTIRKDTGLCSCA